MSSEDQDILSQISKLAGQINRHKNQQQSTSSSPYSRIAGVQQDNRGWRPARGGYGPRGFQRGRRGTPIHRHRTLVLNGSKSSSAGGTGNSTDNDTPETASVTNIAPAWVSKTDRHLQLINPAIFEKQTQDRTKAIEATRKLRLKQRDEHERLKIDRHLQRLGTVPLSDPTRVRPSATTTNYEIIIQGIKFRITKGGSKLVKTPDDDNTAKATPKTATVGGVKFYRSKNGNLYRSGIVKAQRRSGVVKKINEPCKAFSTTGTCLKGPRCRYIHDPSKVAICKDLLQKGTCPLGDSCDLSHDLTPERTPTCLHFARGNCSNDNCRYSHVRVSPSALVCRDFGIYGYCGRGADCAERHVNECPDFSNTGECKTKGCKLLHRYKASVIRKNAALADHGGDEGDSDLSSDEDQDEIDSDDVDSDEVDEEFFGGDNGTADTDVLMQEDFVQL